MLCQYPHDDCSNPASSYQVGVLGETLCREHILAVSLELAGEYNADYGQTVAERYGYANLIGDTSDYRVIYAELIREIFLLSCEKYSVSTDFALGEASQPDFWLWEVTNHPEWVKLKMDALLNICREMLKLHKSAEATARQVSQTLGLPKQSKPEAQEERKTQIQTEPEEVELNTLTQEQVKDYQKEFFKEALDKHGFDSIDEINAAKAELGKALERLELNQDDSMLAVHAQHIQTIFQSDISSQTDSDAVEQYLNQIGNGQSAPDTESQPSGESQGQRQEQGQGQEQGQEQGQSESQSQDQPEADKSPMDFSDLTDEELSEQIAEMDSELVQSQEKIEELESRIEQLDSDPSPNDTLGDFERAKQDLNAAQVMANDIEKLMESAQTELKERLTESSQDTPEPQDMPQPTKEPQPEPAPDPDPSPDYSQMTDEELAASKDSMKADLQTAREMHDILKAERDDQSKPEQDRLKAEQEAEQIEALANHLMSELSKLSAEEQARENQDKAKPQPESAQESAQEPASQPEPDFDLNAYKKQVRKDLVQYVNENEIEMEHFLKPNKYLKDALDKTVDKTQVDREAQFAREWIDKNVAGEPKPDQPKVDQNTKEAKERQAQAFSNVVIKTRGTTPEQIREAINLYKRDVMKALGREPTEKEQQLMAVRIEQFERGMEQLKQRQIEEQKASEDKAKLVLGLDDEQVAQARIQPQPEPKPGQLTVDEYMDKVGAGKPIGPPSKTLALPIEPQGRLVEPEIIPVPELNSGEEQPLGLAVEVPEVDPELIDSEELQEVISLVKLRENIQLIGPAGSGKTYYAEQAAAKLGMRYASQSVTEGMRQSDLLGYLLPIGNNGKFSYTVSSFVDVYENGGVFLLDELDRADANTLMLLNNALSGKHFFLQMRYTRVKVKKHPDFVCIATSNTLGAGSQDTIYVANRLDGSTIDRFVLGRVWVGYSAEVEEKLVDPFVLDWGRGLRAFINAQPGGDLEHIVSTRTLIKASKHVQAGRSLKKIEASYFLDWGEDELMALSAWRDAQANQEGTN